MDIKPVHPAQPPAPLHRVEEQEDMRREQRRQQQARDEHTRDSEHADDGRPHIDAYA
ncbi:MAG: hypothetical protein IT492_13640 [Gammaproteobacteria bacterium]|nr:hypothetical protein [Gammaproteobacteria bacterium]